MDLTSLARAIVGSGEGGRRWRLIRPYGFGMGQSAAGRWKWHGIDYGGARLRRGFSTPQPADLARERAHGFGARDRTQHAECVGILAGESAGESADCRGYAQHFLHPQIPLGGQDGTKY
jgi:hypothetical protein